MFGGVAITLMPPLMRKPILLTLAQTIGFFTPASSNNGRSIGTFIVMKPGSAPYFFFTWRGERAERLDGAKSDHEVRDDVLQENDRRRQAVEHLHLGIDQKADDRAHVLA